MKTLREVGSEAYDTVESVVDIDKAPHAPSECIVSLDFKDRRVGLPLILAVCSAISSDTEARRYTIREFNCYFFSWTIIATVARYCVAWESVPYAANSLCLPRGKLSETIAQGVIKELTGSLPNALSAALSAALPEMLIVNIPHSVPELPAYVNLFRGDFPPQLRLKLSSDSFRTELSKILQWQNQVITEALSNPLNYERLREAIESLALQGHRHGHLDRASLSILLQRLLWQGDVVPTLSSNMDKWAGQWNTPEGTEEMMGGEGLWAVTSRTLVEFVAKDIQTSVSSQIAQRVSSIVVDILGSEAGSTATRGQITPATIISSVQRVVDHAISEITEFSVKNLVGRMREHMEVTRGAIQDTIIHNVKDLFPSELPIGLRIPKAQNSRLRQLLWLARPESAFCLWRTPRELQTCDLVKHQELQNYLYRRIKAHSRDVRVLGGGPREVEASIRKAMGRIWLAGSMILAGLNNRPGVNAFDKGGISISFYEGTK